MFKKEELEKNKEALRRTLKRLELERDLIIEEGRSVLNISPSYFFYSAVEALFDVFPEMKKNKKIAGYYDRVKKFTEVYLLVFPESDGDVPEEKYDIRLNVFKVALLKITKEIDRIKEKLGS